MTADRRYWQDAPHTMRDVWGRARPITWTWPQQLHFPNGGWQCPFCDTPTKGDYEVLVAYGDDGQLCDNPGCPAYCEAVNAFPFLERDHAEALAEQERRQRASILASVEEYRTAGARISAHTRAALKDDAERNNQCVACATWDISRPRFVRHRRPENCPLWRI